MHDVSGAGSHKYGGRWNNKGTYMLYTSINSSLAYLENLVHFNEFDAPDDLFIVAIEIKNANETIYELPDAAYPENWKAPGNMANKVIGDRWMSENKFVAFKVRSAVNPSEYNFLINPVFPGFRDIVIVQSVEPLSIDSRLLK